jgi:predicted nucleic acid-binding protein
LIAVVAIRNRAAVLERDRDFEVLARHSALQLVSG